MPVKTILQNRFLRQLPIASASRVEERLTSASFEPGQVLRVAGEPIPSIHFIEHGLVSLVSGPRSNDVETGLLGNGGIMGASVILGAEVAPSTAIARIGGRSSVLRRADFDHLAQTDIGFSRHLHRYIHERMLASAHSVVAATRCTIEQRLAGWLLDAQDALQEEELQLTHECLASTLGVRRPGVTVALHLLEGKQAIRSLRRRIQIRSRDLLLETAGCAYMLAPDPRTGKMDTSLAA